MSLTSETRRVQYTLSGSGQTLPVTFKFFAAGDLKVTKTVSGVDTTLVLNTDYSVTGGGTPAATGSVVMVAGANGDVITISGNATQTQGTDLTNNGPLPAETLTAMVDRLTMLVQQVTLSQKRSLRVPVSAGEQAEPTLAQRASAIVAFDADGDLDWTYGQTFYDDVAANAAAAAASASAAASSASAASTSASSASGSASAASSSAAAASSSASAASSSATAAAASAAAAAATLANLFLGGIGGGSVPSTASGAGAYYVITSAGTSQTITWKVGDWAVYNGSSGSWTRIPFGDGVFSAITAPASTDLTLAGGSTGAASIVLKNGAGTGAPTITLGNLGAMQNIRSGSNLILQMEGDSLTNPNGYGSTNSTSTWAYYLRTNFPWASGAGTYNNAATSGASYATVAARYAASVYPNRPTAGKQALLFIWVGINDISTGTAASTLYTNIKSYWATARADGFTIVAFTLAPGILSSAQETERQTFNELVRSDPSLYDFLIEPDAAFLSNLVSTYFQAGTDKAHLNAYGNQLLAAEINRVVFQSTTATYNPQSGRTLARYIGNTTTFLTAVGVMDVNGKVSFAPTSGQNFEVTTAGAGVVKINTALLGFSFQITNSNNYGTAMELIASPAGSGSGHDWLIHSAGSSAGIGAGWLSIYDLTANSYALSISPAGRIVLRNGSTPPTDNGTDLLQIYGSISATGGVKGTTTNDSATAGYVGELQSATLASGSSTSLTTNTAKTITSISLTAGDWDVSGVIYFQQQAGTTSTYLIATLTTTNNGDPVTDGRAVSFPGVAGNVADWGIPVGPFRFSLASTTTIYLSAKTGFSGGTSAGYGAIRARRVR